MIKKSKLVLAIVIVLFLFMPFLKVNANENYSLDFENYDNVQGVAEYSWFNIGCICDASIKEVISGEEAITGKSLKVGSASEGYVDRNNLFAFQGGTIPFVNGKYTMTFDVKFNNANSFNFTYLITNVDTVVNQISFNPTNINETIACNSKYYSVSEKEGYYTVSIDLTPGEQAMWAYFGATFGTNGGYVVIDNINIVPSTNDYSRELLFEDKFESYNEGEGIPAYLWNNTHLWSDATTSSVVDSFDGKALKFTLNEGTFSAANLFGLKGGNANPTTAGCFYETSFDLALTNINSFTVQLQYNLNGDKNYSEVKILEDGTIYSELNCKVVKNEKGFMSISIQYEAYSSDIFGYFKCDSKANGVILFDNYAMNKIESLTNEVPGLQPTYLDYVNFENYNGTDSIPSYLWNNTKLWSDVSSSSVVNDGIEGKSLKIMPGEGYSRAANLMGLKGNQNYPTTVGNIYHLEFDFKADNVADFGLVLLCNISNVDKEMCKININPLNGLYKSSTYASVTNMGEYYHVQMEFTALSSEFFGYFECTANTNANIIFDNYSAIKVKEISLPNVMLYENFDNVNLTGISIETNYYKDKQILGKLTNDSSSLINGTYSFIGGFDASKLTDKWGKLFSIDNSLDNNKTYYLQFKYKAIDDSENYFYVDFVNELKQETFVRFNNGTIVESKNIIDCHIDAKENYNILYLTVKTNEINVSSILLGTNGGGQLVVDDLVIGEGTNYYEYNSDVKEIAAVQNLVFEENFETQTPGDNLILNSFISGVDVFGTKWYYQNDKINGKISLNMYSGNDWSECVKTKSGLIKNNQVYTFVFRYKSLGDAANINFILRNGLNEEKYMAFSCDGKPSAFTTAGGSFYQGIFVYDVITKDGYNEAYLTFNSFNQGDNIISLGTYGVANFIVDDIALYEGSAYSLSSVNVVSAPDKNDLLLKLTTASQIDENLYTPNTYNTLGLAYEAGLAIYEKLDSSEDEVNSAIKSLNDALNNLKVLADKNDLDSLVKEIEELDQQKYTPTSFEEIATYLSESKEVLKDANATQTEVDKCVTELTKLKSALVLRADFSRLNAKINEIEALSANDYTTTSFNALKGKTDEAKVLLQNTNATQAEVDQCVTALAELKNALVLRADFTSLSAKINEIEALSANDYTTTSFNALKEKTDEAKVLLQNTDATQAEVDQCVSALAELKNALVLRADFTSLSAKIEEIDALSANNYISTTFNPLKEKSDEAKLLLQNTNATQAEVDQCVTRLAELKNALVLRGNKTELNTLVENLENLDKKKYTEETYYSLKEAIDNAKELLNNDDVTQEQIDDMINTLNTKNDSLVIVKTGCGANNIGYILFLQFLLFVRLFVFVKKH